MGLQFVREPDPDAGHVIASARLCRTEDDRLVPDTDPDARWLFCVPGAAIPRAEAERYGLLDVEPEPEAEPEEPSGEESKASRPPANKSRSRAGDK